MKKLKLSNKTPGLFLGNCIHNLCIIMDIHCKLLPLNKESISISLSQAEKLVRKDCNNFLKTKQGFHYLIMKYPNLSVSQAVSEYIKTALRIDFIV